MTKIRTLVILVLLAGALIAGAIWMQNLPSKPTSTLIGSKIFPGLPINQIHKIMLATTSNTLTLAKTKDIWTVANRFNYPADFDKIADSLLQLRELKIGQVINADESQKGAFQLLDPGPPSVDHKEQSGMRLELRDANDGLLASMLIGKPFMRTSPNQGMPTQLDENQYPDGRYIQTADGHICLVSQTLEYLDPEAKNWLAKVCLSVMPNDIEIINVTAPNRAPIALAREKNGDAFVLAGLQAAEGYLDRAKVDQISRALNNLAFDDIAAPTLSPKATGMDNPLVFKAHTRQGRIYTFYIGSTLTNDTFDRYVRVTVDGQPPTERPANANDTIEASRKDSNTTATIKADQTNADATQVLNDGLSSWTFIIKSYRAEPFLIKRAELIKKNEPLKTNNDKEVIDPTAAEEH